MYTHKLSHVRGGVTNQVYCYCYEKVWSDEPIELDPQLLYKSQLCGASRDKFSLEWEPDCRKCTF